MGEDGSWVFTPRLREVVQKALFNLTSFISLVLSFTMGLLLAVLHKSTEAIQLPKSLVSQDIAGQRESP